MKLSIFKPQKDAFDDIEDAFSDVELPADEKVLLSPDLDRKIQEAVRKAVEALKSSLPPPMPSKEIVREIRVEVPSKDKRELVEKSALDAALKKIAELEEQLEETDRIARTPQFVPGGSGVIGIPDPGQATDGHVLTVETGADGRKAKFKAPTGGSGSGLSGYTVTNGTELKTFNAQSVSIDELAAVVATIIDDLQA